MKISNLLDVVIKVLAAVLVGGVITVLPKIKEWLASKIGKAQVEQLEETVKKFVVAAEQVLKMDDPTGEKRKEYVVEQLASLEVEVDGYVDAVIESMVNDLGHELTKTTATTTKKTTNAKK